MSLQNFVSEKMEFDYTRILIEECDWRQVLNDDYVGVSCFILKKEFAPKLVAVMDKVCKEGKEISTEKIETSFRNNANKEFIPDKGFIYRGCYHLTDGVAVYDFRVWWIICEFLGCAIFYEKAYEPHRLSLNGADVGYSMGCNPDVLHEAVFEELN